MRKISTKRQGKILLLLWLVSPIALIVLTFATWNELSASSIIFTAGFVTPYIVMTGIFTYGVLFAQPNSSRRRGITLSVLPIIGICYFIYRNAIPYRIFLAEGENDSPFDKVWYFWPQTAYGYPSPAVRIFDQVLPIAPHSSWLIDISSLLMNIWFLSGFVFIAVGLGLIVYSKFSKNLSEQVAASDR